MATTSGELDDRKATILRAVVTEYIETAQPVGSAHVTGRPGIDVSSATIRHEMAGLEHEGYLTQPHTSAGRVPTDKGYRFFVDSLSGTGTLRPVQRQQIRDFFAKAHGELEQMLHDTSQLLSRLTDSAAVVVGPPHQATSIRSVQLVGLTPRLVLLVVVLSDGSVEKSSLELSEEIGDASLAAAGARLGQHLAGASLAHVTVPPAGAEPAIDSLMAAAVRAARKMARTGDVEQVFVGGASRVATAFAAADTVRSVLGILEQQYLVVTLLRDVVDRGLSVAIGAEHGVVPLADCAVVVAPYGLEGDTTGAVGVLGPTRMDYSRALAAVALVSDRLDRRLGEG